MKKPLVSIIIPVYNGELHLQRCIESAISQTYENKEIIVIDDGSTDNTYLIAQNFKSETLTLYRQCNKGSSAARNYGLSLSNGEYIQFLDADDFLSEDKISAQVDALSGSANKIAVCSTVHFFLEEDLGDLSNCLLEDRFLDKHLKPYDFLLNIFGILDGVGGMVQPNAWLTPIQIINKAGLWNEKLTVDDDGEYFCRVILNSTEIVHVKTVLNYYRKYRRGYNLSSHNSYKAKKSKYEALCLKQRHLDVFKKPMVIEPSLSGSFYKLAVECYASFKRLSKMCIDQATSLDKNYYKKNIYIGSKIMDFLANNISWKLARLLQDFKQRLDL